MSKKQKGFTLIETLLLVVIFAVIGGTGYYVYHTKQQTDSTYNSATQVQKTVAQNSNVNTFADCQKASGSIIQETYPEVCVTKNGQKFIQPTNSSSSTNSQTYFTIKEWGVRAQYSGSAQLEYKIFSSAIPGVASFSSTQLDVSDAKCLVDLSKSGGYGGLIDRYKSTDEYLIGALGADSGKTAAQYAATLKTGTYGKVGDYYYFYQHPQASCSDQQASMDLQTQTQGAVYALLPKLQSVPQ